MGTGAGLNPYRTPHAGPECTTPVIQAELLAPRHNVFNKISKSF